MATNVNLPAGFQLDEPQQESSGLPAGFIIDEQQEPSIMQKAADFVTGESRMTPEMEQLSEIGNAPELNEMSWSAFKTSLGLLATGDEDKSMNVIKSNIPSAEFTRDAAGNVIVNLPSGKYALNKPGVSGQDIAKGVFDFAAFTPAGRAATLPRAALGAGATELGLQTAAQQVGGGPVDLGDVGMATAFGGAGKAAENVISAGGRLLTGAPSDEISLARQFAQERGAPLATTDVVPPQTFAGKSAQAAAEKIPVTGTGAMRRTQQEARQKTIQDFSGKFGEYSPDEIVSSLKRQTNRVKRAAGNMRSETVSKMDDVGIINTSNAVDAIDNEIARLSRTPSGQAKATADTATISKLEDYKQDLLSDPSFSNIEQMRTQFRTDVKGERMVMPNQSEAAVNNIYKQMSKDMDIAIRDNLGGSELAKWKKSNAAYANEAIKIKNTRIKTALEKGELTPEVVNNMLYSSKPSEVRSLYSSLDQKGKRQARAGLIGKAVEKAGDSPDKFLNEINRMSKQTGIAFKGDDKKYLDGMKAYLEATRRAGQAGVTTPTGQELFQIAAPAGVATDVMGTGGMLTGLTFGYGGLAKAYESAPVRDLMIKISATSPKSEAFDQYLSAISSNLRSFSQAVRDEGE